jgi:hypothetical protein
MIIIRAVIKTLTSSFLISSPLAPHPIMIPIKPVRIRRQHREILEFKPDTSPHHNLQLYINNTYYVQFNHKSHVSFVTLADLNFHL